MSWSMASSLEAFDQPANCVIQSVISAGGLSLSGMNLLLVEQDDVEDDDDDEVDGIGTGTGGEGRGGLSCCCCCCCCCSGSTTVVEGGFRVACRCCCCCCCWYSGTVIMRVSCGWCFVVVFACSANENQLGRAKMRKCIFIFLSDSLLG